MDDTERQRRAVLVLSALRTMAIMALIGFVGSFVDSRNDVRVSLAFYFPVFSGVVALWWLTTRGHVVAAAWALSLFFWGVIAFVTLKFGGLQGHYGACFVVVSMLMGTVVSGRAGIGMALASVGWSALVAWLDTTGRLPEQLGPAYSPTNAWTALSVTLILAAVLMSYSLNSIQRAAAERDEALRRSIQAQKMELVGRLAAGVAHDFNNLLMVISATSEQLRHADDPHTRRELLHDLDEATTRATLMTRQLLSFGRGQAAPMLTPIDVAQAVREFSGMLSRLLGSKISVTVEAPEPLFARANRAGLEQILLNLAVNARDAMPSGGTLRLAVSADGDSVCIDCGDSGVGMDPATLERIFQPFFTTRTTGTGLGLATVHERVTQFAGTIAVTSAPGKGTTFTVRLPRVTRELSATPRVDAAPQPAHAASQRLLLVEDDHRVRRSVTGLLEHAGFDVIAVSNGVEALQLLRAPHSFACVITDLSMPLMDGDTLAAELETLAPTLPMVLMSGNRAPAGAVLDSKRRVFIEKPATREALLGAIERVLSALA